MLSQNPWLLLPSVIDASDYFVTNNSIRNLAYIVKQTNPSRGSNVIHPHPLVLLKYKMIIFWKNLDLSGHPHYVWLPELPQCMWVQSAQPCKTSVIPGALYWLNRNLPFPKCKIRNLTWNSQETPRPGRNGGNIFAISSRVPWTSWSWNDAIPTGERSL